MLRRLQHRVAAASPATSVRPCGSTPSSQGLGENPIAQVHQRARARRDAGLPLVDFSIGDPREATPEFIPEALRAAVPVVSQYPLAVGIPEVRAAVADYVARRFGVTIDPATQVIPTSGSKEAVFSTPLAFVERAAADTVVYGSPGYPVYERGAKFAGATAHPVTLSGDFVLRASDVTDDVWERTALVWVCTPHNPTGAVTSHSELAELWQTCRTHKRIAALRRGYADVYEPGSYPERATVLVAGRRDDLEGVLAYLSLSKRSGMTGYRSGAIVGDADAISALRGLRTMTGTVPAEFVQAAAVAAWSDDEHAAKRPCCLLCEASGAA